jgi:hypothetical protein
MSNLNIFIPTYKRPKTLYWSIESVLMQDFKNQIFKKNIIIINNDESTIDEIRKVVNLVIKNNPNHQFNNIELIQGNKNLVDKNLLLIYELMFSKSEINDISIVHCDDDIMLPNTLLNRYLNSKDSQLNVFIEKFIEPAYFFQNDDHIYFHKFNYKKSNNLFNKAVYNDLVLYSIPFYSVYTYKITPEFKNIYHKAIEWADQINLKQKIKYPFVPFFIGLSAYFHNQLATADNNIVIRGTLFNKNMIRYPRVETEYANTGIILLTGLFVLKNKDLEKIIDFDILRDSFKQACNEFLLVTLLKKDGVSFNELKRLLECTGYKFNVFTYLSIVSFKSIRNLFNNLFFDSRFIKRYIIGWGKRYNRIEFINNI